MKGKRNLRGKGGLRVLLSEYFDWSILKKSIFVRYSLSTVSHRFSESCYKSFNEPFEVISRSRKMYIPGISHHIFIKVVAQPVI